MRVRFQPHHSGRDRGFTLIEVLVVVIVMSVLASVSVPVYLRQRKKAVDASLKADVLNTAKAAETISIDQPSNASALTSQVFGPAALRAAGATESLSNYVLISGNPAEGFCVVGGALNGTGTYGLGSGYFWYDSTNGGLQPVPLPLSAFPATGPCSSPLTTSRGWQRVSW